VPGIDLVGDESEHRPIGLNLPVAPGRTDADEDIGTGAEYPRLFPSSKTCSKPRASS